MWARDGDSVIGTFRVVEYPGWTLQLKAPTWVAGFLSSGQWIAGDALTAALAVCYVRVTRNGPESKPQGRSETC